MPADLDASFHERLIVLEIPAKERSRGARFFTALVNEVTRMSTDPELFDDSSSLVDSD